MAAWPERRCGRDQRSGNSDAITDRLVEIAEADFTVINVALPAARAIERFAVEVIPSVRARIDAC
jgi:hypothetical protein